MEDAAAGLPVSVAVDVGPWQPPALAASSAGAWPWASLMGPERLAAAVAAAVEEAGKPLAELDVAAEDDVGGCYCSWTGCR